MPPIQLPVTEGFLKFLLGGAWSVSCKDDMLQLVMIRGENPYIQRSITLHQSGKVRIFIHSQPLPGDHWLWKTFTPQAGNIGSLCDCLAKLAKNVFGLTICEAIREYPYLWENLGDGTITEKVADSSQPVLRSKNCSLLLIKATVCKPCKLINISLKRSHDRLLRRNAGITKSECVNYKHLDKAESARRSVDNAAEKRKERRKRLRLQAKMELLIRRDGMHVGESMSEDLVKIMKDNWSQLSKTQRMFWTEQIKAISNKNNPRRRRWHPIMIRIALALRKSASTYKDVQDLGIIELPSLRLLYDYTNFIELKEGCQEEILKDIKGKLKFCKENHEKFCHLMLDEMHIRSNLVLNRKNGDIIGYTNLNDVESELLKFEQDVSGEATVGAPVAKKVLVFMLRGIKNPLKSEVVAVYSTDELSAAQLHARTWEVIYHLEKSEIPVLTLAFDGASTNRSFVHMHVMFNYLGSPYVTTNFTSPDRRPLFFIMDPPHLLKTIRNCFSNSFAHKNSRKLQKDGKILSWKSIQKLFEIATSEKYTNHKLTMDHVTLTSFSKMKVYYAAQVMSASVAKALRKYKNHDLLKGFDAEATAYFIELVNDWFDCLNADASVLDGKRADNTNLHPYMPGDPRFDFLLKKFMLYFDDWEREVAASGKSKKEKKKMMLSWETNGGLRITTHNFVAVSEYLFQQGATSIEARVFNQDPLEQYFSRLRAKGGSSDNPDLKQVLHSRLALHVQQNVGRGNKRQHRSFK